MNKGVVMAIIAGLVLVGGAFFFFNNNNPSEESMTSETVTSDSSSFQSIRDLVKLGENQTCTFTDIETGSEGTVYVSGDNVRTNFTVVTDEMNYNSHMISNGENVYVWQEEMEGGFVMSIDEAEEMQDSPVLEGNESTENIDFDREVDYKCSSWKVDNSMFAVPTDREFTDPTAMMEEAMEKMGESMKESGIDLSDQCGTCDSLPGDAGDQCRKALSCE